jgi:hypothetical protein
MAWFYEIRSSSNTVLKRDGGFPTQDAAKNAGREESKKMKNLRQPDKPDVGRIMVGQNTEKPTRRVAQPLAGGAAFGAVLNFRVADPLFLEGLGFDFSVWAGGIAFGAVLNFRVADPLAFRGSGF